MTEYRQQAAPPAIAPSAPLGSRDNPLPFRVFKKCLLCGDGLTGFYGYGRIDKNVIRRHDGVLLLEHRHSGTGCSGTWHTRTALDERTTTVRGGTAAEMLQPGLIVLLASVGVILAIGVFFGLLLGGV